MRVTHCGITNAFQFGTIQKFNKFWTYALLKLQQYFADKSQRYYVQLIQNFIIHDSGLRPAQRICYFVYTLGVTYIYVDGQN